MSFEVDTDRAICFRCGSEYSRRKGFFSSSYAAQHKGVGYLPVCKKCVETMYEAYLSQCHDAGNAVRQVCRKLDLYWSKKVFDSVSIKSGTRSLMSRYITRINGLAYAGKSYDHTLSEEGTLWSFTKLDPQIEENQKEEQKPSVEIKMPETEDLIEITPEIVSYWGEEYASNPEMYVKLEQRHKYYLERLPQDEIDIGTEILLRQVCVLEVCIARDSASGKAVDKSINSLNSLIGGLNLKPIQKKDDADSSIDKTPMGVWIKKLEDERPLPEVDPELKDVDGIVRYVTIWFLGHLCKMLNIKNTYCKLYEDAIANRRLQRPDLDEEDDETFFDSIFNNENDDGDG